MRKGKKEQWKRGRIKEKGEEGKEEGVRVEGTVEVKKDERTRRTIEKGRRRTK